MAWRAPDDMTADELRNFIRWLREQATQREIAIHRLNQEHGEPTSCSKEKKVRRELRNYRGAVIACERLLKQKQQASVA